MKYLFLATLILTGCVDKHTSIPFKCECDCEDNRFECTGRSVELQQDVVKKYIKNTVN